MIYLQRDKFGRLLRVESTPFEGMTERLATPSKEVIDWQARIEARDRLGRLRESDADMIRVLEDLIGVLVERGVLRYTDLPEAARNKLRARAEYRAALGSLNQATLMGDEEDEGGLL